MYTSNYAETTLEMRTLGELTGWREEYWDQHPTTAIWKVDSHQLKENGAKGDRYDPSSRVNSLFRQIIWPTKRQVSVLPHSRYWKKEESTNRMT